jgi:4,5-DOPA dioxygenase extradiol
MSDARTMPAAFFGHGSPMNALELNRYTHAWRAFGQAVPRPRAILVVSAHWYINATAVTAMPRPRTIHDFYGFPPELFDVQYPAPGLPELAEEVSDIVRPTWVGADVDSWGIDHGTWSVLRHAFPDAAIPVVQLSINQFKDFGYHLDLGARLDAHRDFASAVPTPDHFIPLLYLAGLAAAARDKAPRDGTGQDPDDATRVLVDGCAYGSLSMTAYTLGLDVPDAAGTGLAAEAPEGIPADGTNL